MEDILMAQKPSVPQAPAKSPPSTSKPKPTAKTVTKKKAAKK
jgi:hypothetical protein